MKISIKFENMILDLINFVWDPLIINEKLINPEFVKTIFSVQLSLTNFIPIKCYLKINCQVPN